jgi:hypothetical protein
MPVILQNKRSGLLARIGKALPLIGAALIAAGGLGAEPQPTVVGIDHVIVAVRDLEGTAERYRQLGFALKPGRLHDDSIRNQHVKFPNGSEIELITASEPRDELARDYLKHLAQGDGPAYLVLYAPSPERLEAAMTAAGQPYHRSYLLSPKGEGLGYLFFGQRNAVPSDRPEHFAHANGAETLAAVWLAGEGFAKETALLAALGVAGAAPARLSLPGAGTADIQSIPLPEGRIQLLPSSFQARSDRRIVGVTLITSDLQRLRNCLAQARLPVPPTVKREDGDSVFLPPALTHGLWIELHEKAAVRTGPGPVRNRGPHRRTTLSTSSNCSPRSL